MKLLMENWRSFIEEEEEYIPQGEEMMFSAKYLTTHMGEYDTEQRWKDFAQWSQEEQIEWAKNVKFDEPVEVTVFRDGMFGFGDGHHRVKAAKLLDIEIPIIITNNKMKDKDLEVWNLWIDLVKRGHDPKKMNPEGWLLNSVEQVEDLVK